jgi:ethanolaminephosphotransferase
VHTFLLAPSKMISSHLLRTTSLTLANILIPVAVLVFAAGFFPYKPVLPGLADWRDGADAEEETGSGTPAPFNKVIFMVVDALRSDFVFGEDSAMGFVQRCVLTLPYIQSVD